MLLYGSLLDTVALLIVEMVTGLNQMIRKILLLLNLEPLVLCLMLAK